MTYNFEDLFDENGDLVENFSYILKKSQSELWLKKLYTFPGKTTTQKIYNYKHQISETPKCSQCGKSLKFLNAKEGYYSCCEEKVENTYDDITQGHPKVISQEKDFEKNEIQSSILTTLGSNTDEEVLLKEHGLNPTLWKISKIKHSIWQQNSKKDGCIDLYASKITAIPRTIGDLTEEQILEKFEKISKYKSSLNPKPFRATKSGRTLVIPIADLHFGLLVAESNTSHKYNMKIASERIIQALQIMEYELFNEKNSIENIILTLGNDYYNADNLLGTTTRGTPQDQEENYFDIFEKGVTLAIDIIEKIAMYFKNAIVNVYNIQSNHDKITSNALMNCLYYKYLESKQIKVFPESGKNPRIYIRAGNNLFGFGHETKMSECARLMSSEAKESWSTTLYKTFFLAHLHKEEVNEIGEVVIRRLPILSEASRWTTEMGFVKGVPRTQMFLFSNINGLEKIINVNIPRRNN